MATTGNGQVRKTLASQLDRLDNILDALSDGLNEAVATAVEGAVERAVRQAVGLAVKEAMQAVLTEVLTNADLLATLRTVLPTTPAESTPNPPEPPKSLWRRACDGLKVGLVAAGTACTAFAGHLGGVKTAARSGWRLAKKFKGRVLAACGIGVAAGVVTYWAGPWLGIAAGWLSGFAVSLAVQGRNALRRLFAPAPVPAFA
ncbi:MAG TPA: hypothetical protein VEL76_13595 [Gemmataceae bacterium]|nr:hypothetical protein [Gemmataceae bacterium]